MCIRDRIDTDSQYILSQKITLEHRNDNIDFEPIMKNINCKFVVAGKGYNSKSNQYFVLRKMKAHSIFLTEKLSSKE